LNRDFGPLHDRVELTMTETRTIARLERVLTVDAHAGPRHLHELRAELNLTTRMIDTWVSFRPWAVWMLPLASLGIVLALLSSVLIAALFAAAWAVGFGALLAESRARFNAKRQAQRAAHDEQDG
jgi:hypothetical protein